MKVKSRVRKSPMWKYDQATGTVIKITEEYVVVKWDAVPGEWHYTKKQALLLEVIDKQ